MSEWSPGISLETYAGIISDIPSGFFRNFPCMAQYDAIYWKESLKESIINYPFGASQKQYLKILVVIEQNAIKK